jgi:dTDP-4-dehydrorhamnose 3,5-epimerase
VTSPRAQVEYKCTAIYDPTDEVGIAYDDEQLGIPWPVINPVVSAKDIKNPGLAEVVGLLTGSTSGCPLPVTTRCVADL